MIDPNLTIQLWTTKEGKYGDEQQYIDEITVQEVAELNEIKESEVTYELFLYQVKEALDSFRIYYKNNHKESK